MDFVKNLKDILESQKTGLKKFEEELSSIEKTDILNEYGTLEKKAKTYESELESLKAKNSVLKKECSALKEALSAEMYSQKLLLLNFSKERVFNLYRDFEVNNSKGLAEIEFSAEQTLAQLSSSIAGGNLKISEEIQSRIQETKKLVYEYKQNLEQEVAGLRTEFHDRFEKEYAGLVENKLTEEQIKKRTANTNIEMKLGRRITNIAGIAFVLIGVALGLQYTFTNLITSVYVKSGAAFFLGLLFLGFGELMNRKSRSVFSLGITAGGIAILFTVTGISYFYLNLFSMPFAFGLTILISTAAFFLSFRYKSQTIAIFAYIGAFLPIFSAMQVTDLEIIFGYLLILNLFVLLLYTKKDWSILKYISFPLNLICFFTLTMMGLHDLPCSTLVIFVVANYMIYVTIPLVSALRNAKTISTGSSVILTINTLFSAGLIFILLNANHYNHLFGLTSLIMAAFFIGLGYFVYRTIRNKHLLVLFLGTAFIFAVLVVPLQFDSRWISLGWLAEATGLLIIGILLENKWYRIGGILILVFSMVTFLLVDFPGIHDIYYIGKASAISFSCIAVLACSILKHRKTKGYIHTFEGRFLWIFKNFVSILCFLYLIMLNDYFILQPYGMDLFLIITVYICFVISFVFEFVKVLKDQFTRVLQTIFIILGIVINLILNTLYLPDMYMVLVILANAVAAVLIWLYTNQFIKRGKLSREAQTIIISIFALVIILQILVCQYDYSLNSMVISSILVFASLGLIIAGFIKRYAYLRRFGLVLNLISIIKFFILDLYFLGKEERIISYFILGFVLIGISYVYQHFSKRLFKQNEHDEG